jgi:hypothetical protein
MTTLDPKVSGASGISGDPTKQAINALRGYAYQIYVSAIAWLQLRENQELYLEVAEDYAVAANGALNAVQVKDTAASGSVTLGSSQAAALLDSLIQLKQRNPDRRVSVRLLSTSRIGLEKRKNLQVEDGPALEYWRKAAAGADVTPLRASLENAPLSPETISYIAALDDAQLRQVILQCVHWDCGQPPLAAVRAELEQMLVGFAWDHGQIPPSEAGNLTAPILEHLLMNCSEAGSRKLSRADLLLLIEAQTRLSVSRSDAEKLIKEDDKKAQFVSERRLLPESELMLPNLLAERPEFNAQLIAELQSKGAVVLTGGTGMGKTIAARLAARATGKSWSILDLRDLEPSIAVNKLMEAIPELSKQELGGVLIDDANQIDDPVVMRAMAVFLHAMKRRDQLCIATLYRRPSTRALSESNITPEAVIETPALTGADVDQLITQAGGDSEKWGTAIYATSDNGHPQLVQASIAGLQSRDWPESELSALMKHGLSSKDVLREKATTRTRLVNSVPEASRTLLYRLSLGLGGFDRKTVFRLGKLSPSLSNAGELFDQLVGPWIDEISASKFRISPLLYGAGNEVFDEEDTQAIHHAFADAIMESEEISVAQAGSAYLHGLSGKAEPALMKLAHGIIAADAEDRRNVSRYLISLRLTQTKRPILPDNGAISKMLRLAQLLVCLDFGTDEEVKKVWDALWREKGGTEPGSADPKFEAMIISKLLLSDRASKAIPDWFDLLLRLEELARTDEAMKSLVREMDAPGTLKSAPRMFGMLFMSQAMRIGEPAALADLFERLDSVGPELRHEFLGEYDRVPTEFGLLVNSAWITGHEAGTLDPEVAIAALRKMSGLASSWNYPALAAKCEIAVAVMQDEYLKDPGLAMQTLQAGNKQFGRDDQFARAHAKVLYRQDDYAGALAKFENLDPEFSKNDHIERAFLCREAGICAGKTGSWTDAKEWFLEGNKAAAKVPLDGLLPMAIGLRADAAFASYQAGDTAQAVSELAACLEDLDQLAPRSSLRAIHCYKTIGQLILWLSNEATGDYNRIKDAIYDFPPGMCSNPEPHEGLKDLPMAPLDTVWYMLADAETRFHLDQGVNDRLDERIGQLRIPTMELSLRRGRVVAAIESQDDQAFLCALHDWVDFRAYCMDNRDEFFASDLEDPVRRCIPSATPQQLADDTVRDAAEAAIFAFCFARLASNSHDGLAPLQEQWNLMMAADYPGHELIHVLCNPKSITDTDRLQYGSLLGVVSSGERLSPSKLFLATLRFTEMTAQSEFREVIEKLVDEWACGEWTQTVATQRFALVSPAVSIPALEEAIAQLTGLKRVAAIALAAQSAVGRRLSPEFTSYLANI